MLRSAGFATQSEKMTKIEARTAFSVGALLVAVQQGGLRNVAPQWRGAPCFGADGIAGILTNVNKSMACISGTPLAKWGPSQRFGRQRGRIHGNEAMR
jgi:hypothetical protein